ncbi:hypothetical protein L4A40_26875 [Bacillus cereus]|nr:hypothetical protein [Bacillus cereus]MCH5476711.1 hypothetical protein [Bacillus cereus]
MIYATVCAECEKNHADVLEKKRSKGCFIMLRTTDDKDMCQLGYCREDDE